MRSVYITADKISMDTGGGAVTTNELEALKSVSDDVFVVSRDDIDPALFKQPASPFLEDYFTLQQILLQQEIQKGYFDLAHLYSGCFTGTIRYLKDRGTKVSYTVAAHDRRLSIEEFQRLGLEYPYYHIADDRLWQIYTEGIRLADIVIAPSFKSAEILKSDIGCKNIKVIPHGITWPKKVKPIPENFDCAYVGAIGPDKGLFYLIEAWAMLNYPNSKLILAGPGTESLEPFIRQFTDRGIFVLLGRVSDVAEVYNACSVYIQPSVSEGYGLEIPEALSYGRPVIASEGAGASEIIKDAGFIVPIRNAKLIAEHIDWLKNNRDSMISMGEKGRIIARKYTRDKIQRLYKKVFLEVTQ
jgi:glycosyltransferase involved in cell wall biosynthesis